MNTGSRVLVTAGAAGIGRAIAARFAAAGARVWICDLDAAALEAALRDEDGLCGSLADVSCERDVERLAGEVQKAFGGLDVLVNNAGVSGPTAALEDISVADWTRTFAVNALGAFLMMRAVIPGMKARRAGTIINISTASTTTGLPNRTPYIASKFALEGLTHNAARELGPYGIRVNGIRPGFMDTPRMQGIMSKHALARGCSVAEVEAEALRFISMRAKVAPGEIGEMALYLASDAARHVSGQIIGVCGNVEWEE